MNFDDIGISQSVIEQAQAKKGCANGIADSVVSTYRVPSIHEHGDPTLVRILRRIWEGAPGIVVNAAPGSGVTDAIVTMAANLAMRKQGNFTIALCGQTRAQAVELGKRCKERVPSAYVDFSVSDLNTEWDDNLTQEQVEKAKEKINSERNGSGSITIDVLDIFMSAPPRCDMLIVDAGHQACYANVSAAASSAEQLVIFGDISQMVPFTAEKVRSFRKYGEHPAESALVSFSKWPKFEYYDLPTSHRLGPDLVRLLAPLFVRGPEDEAEEATGNGLRPCTHEDKFLRDDSGAPIWIDPDSDRKIVREERENYVMYTFEDNGSEVPADVHPEHAYREDDEIAKVSRSGEFELVSDRGNRTLMVDGQEQPELFVHRIPKIRDMEDDALIKAAVERARKLIGSVVITDDGEETVGAGDILVTTPRVPTMRAIEAELAGTGVIVHTANQSQGREFKATVAVDPMAGNVEPRRQEANIGMLGVMLTRHNTHVTLVTSEDAEQRLEDTAQRIADGAETEIWSTDVDRARRIRAGLVEF